MDVVSISSLSPSSLSASQNGFRGVVTLIWPFSSSTNQCALLIADADARRRYQKGQVRVRFTGPSARAIAKSGIGIGDDVEIALSGAQWLSEVDTALTKTPGKSVDGELLFNHRLDLSIRRENEEANTIHVDEQDQPKSPKQSMLPPTTPVSRPSTRLSSHYDAYGVAVYSSPAFMKRLRLSEDRKSYTPVSEDDDLDTDVSRKRRRVSYKNVVEWKFDNREPSPDKDRSPENEQEEDNVDVMDTSEIVATPTKESATIPEVSMGDSNNTGEEPAILTEESFVEALQSGTPQPQETTEEAATDIPSAQVPGSKHQTFVSPNVSQPEEQTSLDMPPPCLPRLQIPPVPLDTTQQSLEEEGDRPTTPVLQPISAENLPLPSPFPTSAREMPPSSISNPFTAATTIKDSQQSAKEKVPAEHTAIDAMQSSRSEKPEQTSQPVEESILANTDGHSIKYTAESPSSTVQQDLGRPVDSQSASEVDHPEVENEVHIDHARLISQEISQSLEAAQALEQKSLEAESLSAITNAHDNRVIPDTHEPIEYTSIDSDSSDSDIDVAVVEQPELDEPSSSSGSSVVPDVNLQWLSKRHPADITPSDEMNSEVESIGSGKSESESSDAQYNEEQLAELQQSDQEEVAEEPDWDLLAHQLRDEIDQDALERVEGEEEYQSETNDKIRHDSGSESDELDDDRSDDAIDEEDKPDSSGGSPDPEQNVWPVSDGESSEVSESESFASQVVDFQPTYPEPSASNHHFGLDGAFFSRPIEQPAANDEEEAWNDRQAALQAIDPDSKPPISTMEQGPPQSSSRSKVTVIELPSDSDDEDDEESLSASPEQEKQTMELEQQRELNEEQMESQTNDPQPGDTAMVEGHIVSSDKFEHSHPSPMQMHDDMQQNEGQSSSSSVLGTSAAGEGEKAIGLTPFATEDESVVNVDEALGTGNKTSVGVGDEILDPALRMTKEVSIPVLNTEVAKPDVAESRPLTSHSFTTISSASVHSPLPTQSQTFKSIEKKDLSQIDPEPYVPITSEIQRQSRFPSVPDSVDDSVTELVPGSSRALSRQVSAVESEEEPPTARAQPTSFIMPSQEIGTAFSQLNRGTVSKLDHAPTSQMLAIAEDEPITDEFRAQSQERQAAFDDDLLAEFLEHSPQPDKNDQPQEQMELSSVNQARVIEDDGNMQHAPPPDEVKNATEECESVVPSNTPPEIPLVEQVTSQLQKVASPVSVQPFKSEEKPLSTAQGKAPENSEQLVPEAQKSNSPAVVPEKRSTPGEQGEEIAKPENAVGAIQAVQEETTITAEPPAAVTEIAQPSETDEKMTRRRSEGAKSSLRRSIHAKPNEVPDVISEWFTPRRSSGFIKPLPERDTGDEVADAAPKSPAKSPIRSPAKSPEKATLGITDKAPVKERSISPPPLSRFASQGTSTSLSYFTPLTALPEHLNQSTTIDILAISTSASTSPQQAKSGPKDFYTIFHILDPSLQAYNNAAGSNGKDVTVEVFRPFKMSLPETWTGDVVLLRGFGVKSRKGKIMLRSGAGSGWCVWRFGDTALDYGGEEKPIWARKEVEGCRQEIRGPPVEVGEEERSRVREVRGWWLELKKQEDLVKADEDKAKAKSENKVGNASGEGDKEERA